MRHWHPPAPAAATALLTDLVGELGGPAFGPRLLARMRTLLPASTLSVYRTGRRPALLLTGAAGVPDTTRDCWRAYLSGPHRRDRSLLPDDAARDAAPAAPLLGHVTAAEVQPEHRARVYEAHGVAERVSVVQPQADGGVLAVNFYRHAGHRPYGDAQLADFGALAGAVLALTTKHLALSGLLAEAGAPADDGTPQRRRLQALCPALTARELDVCERLLRGWTHEGVAADLGLSVPTVKTYRNRAFQRLGIHFRSELYGLMLPA